jgi:adenylate cyclase
MPAQPVLPIADKPAIAVLPFTNLGGDPEQEFFADGITEDIITLLAGWRAFPVIARTSTFTYKGRTGDIKKIGEELGARYIVEGSVRKLGHRVRVTAQLIQADTGYHIMVERCDRDLTDLFELRDEIVTAIAAAIAPELLKFERARVAERPKHDENAYELYQRGMRHHHRQNSKTDNIEAQRLFRAALAINLQYTEAVAALTLAVCRAGYHGWTDNAELNYTEAYELAQRAVALDSRYPIAHFALGLVCMWTRRSDRAMAEFREAIRLNPNFANPYVFLAQMYRDRRQPEETIALAEKGIRLNPRDPRLFIVLAGAYYELGHYEQAVEVGRRAWALNPNWAAGLRYVVAGLGQLDRIEEVQTALVELKRHDPTVAHAQAILTQFYRNREDLDHLLDGLRKAGMPEE